MVDSADHEKLDASKNELHSLIDKPQLAGIPVSHCTCVYGESIQKGTSVKNLLADVYIVLILSPIYNFSPQYKALETRLVYTLLGAPSISSVCLYK